MRAPGIRGRRGFILVLAALGAALGSEACGPSPSGVDGASGSGGASGTIDGSGGAAVGSGGSSAGGGTGGTIAGVGGGSVGVGGSAGVGTAGASGSGGAIGNPDAGGDADTDGSIPDASADRPTCSTSISGVVYDPAGQRPVYRAVVYAPTAPLDPITPGVSCDRCGTKLSGAPVAMAISDAAGRFKLEGIPPGSDVPVVIQIGKWRRKVTIPTVTACADTPITDVNLTRLPRTQAEGNIPKIAVSTGTADALECFIRKLGIADSEFTTDAGSGRVNLFAGGQPAPTASGQGATSFSAGLGGAAFPDATGLWGNPAKLMSYDIMLLSCEGSQYATTKAPFVGNIKAFADAGGRIVAGHLQFYWLRNGPAPWPSTATYLGAGVTPPSPLTGSVNSTFPGGAALADWLLGVGASTTRGTLDFFGAELSVSGVNPPTQAWITQGNPTATTLLTFNTPVEAAAQDQCGRVTFADMHMKSVIASQNGKDTSDPTRPFPTGCLATVLSPQEQALAFLFFDVGSCVQ